MSEEIWMLLLQITAWCALPFATRPLLKRSPASTRHLLLTVVLGGTLAIPLLRLAVPAWQAPAWLRPSTLAPLSAGHTSPTIFGGPQRPQVSEVSWRRSGDAIPQTQLSSDSGILLPEKSPATSPIALPTRPLGLSWLSFIWMVGAIAMALRSLWLLRRANRLVHEAAAIDEPRAVQAIAQARAQLGTTAQPQLRRSEQSSVPFAWRGTAPIIVLPACWRRWSKERLLVVLLHELAHVSRRDAWALWIGRAAATLWWFHPLVHKLERWARQECERATDDAVLLSGSRASDYAGHLLAISRALTRPLPPGVAPMMSNSPDLKHRLLAILSADQPRRVLSRRFAAGASLTALAFAVVLAGARFAPITHAQEPEPDVDVEVEADAHHHGAHHQDWHHHDDSDHNSGGRAGKADWKLAMKYHRHGRYEKAIAGFEAAAAAGYNPAVATYNAACGMSLSGRTEDALAALARAVELGLDNPELLAEDSDLDPLRSDDRFQALVNDAFERAGERRDPIDHHRYRHANEALQVLRDAGSEDAKAWAKVGVRLLTLRQLGDAAEALENAARFAREAPATVLYNLACAKALDGRTVDALEALERSIEAGYFDADHMQHDPDLTSLRDEPEFERLTKLAEDLDLNRFQHSSWIGRMAKHWHGHHGGGHNSSQRYSAKTWAPAIDHFRAMVDEQPGLGAAWFNLGYSLHYSERFGEAIDAFERASELGFRPSTATYNAACGYSLRGDVDAAIAALEKAIEFGYHGDLKGDSDLDNLRQDPRFRSLHLKMRLDRD